MAEGVHAERQVSGAVNPGNDSASFRECVIIRHPRQGEFAIGFITGQTLLQVCAGLVLVGSAQALHPGMSDVLTHGHVAQHDKGDTELFSVYVPTNHVYVGDIFLLGKADIIKTNLSVREGLGASLHMSLACCVLIFVVQHKQQLMEVHDAAPALELS